MKKFRTWKITRRIPKYIRQKAKRVNKILDAWSAAGLTSNDVKLAEDLLSNFYENIGATVKDNERATERLFMSRSEKEEYNVILDFILHNDEIDLGKRRLQNEKIRATFSESDEKRYKKFRDMFDQVTDEQSFMDTIDTLNNFSDSRLLKSILDSDQYIALHSAGFSRGLKEDEIDTLIMSIYEKNGKTYDALYNEIISILEGEE